jgi:hypothetical protein
LKFFLTSRLEHHIRQLFDANENRVFKLHEIESSVSTLIFVSTSTPVFRSFVFRTVPGTGMKKSRSSTYSLSPRRGLSCHWNLARGVCRRAKTRSSRLSHCVPSKLAALQRLCASQMRTIPELDTNACAILRKRDRADITTVSHQRRQHFDTRVRVPDVDGFI